MQTIRRFRGRLAATLRTPLVGLTVVALVLSGCSADDGDTAQTYGAPTARVGESQTVLGWNVLVANLRFAADYVLVDVDAAPSDPGAPHAKPEDLRFGLYGALLHPIEATGIGSCQRVRAPICRPWRRGRAAGCQARCAWAPSGTDRRCAGSTSTHRGTASLHGGRVSRGVPGRPARDERRRHRSGAAYHQRRGMARRR